MNTTNSNWLNQLAPDHAPPPLGWWPPAPGWWGLALLLLVSAIALTHWFYHPTQRLRRRALQELKRIEATTTDSALLARDVEHLLRHYALAHYGREAVAKLSGEAWIHFVITHGGKAWAGGVGEEFLRAAYGGHRRNVNTDRSHWLNNALRGAHDFLKGKGRR